MGWKKIIAILCAAAAMVSVIPAGYSGGNEGVYTAAAAATPEPTPEPTPHVNPYIETDQFRFNAATGTIVQYIGSETEVEIPAEIAGVAVTEIGDNAFIYNEMTEVIIPNSVAAIGESAFESCRGITNIVIPDSVVSIGEDAFYGCQYLKNVKLPNGLTSISDGVFWGCRSLEGVTIPEGVISIGAYAFQGCEDLVDITIPKNVVSIGSSAFGSCIGLESITVPDSVTFIDDGAFRGVKRVNLSGENPSYCMVNEMMYSKDKTKLFYCPPDFSETEYHIPDSVTALGASAFYDCNRLKKITIPDAVTEIPDNAFYGCSSLVNIDIPEEVTSIGRYAFGSCSSLTIIEIPEGVEVISFGAFWNCTGLKIVCIPKSVYSIERDAFRYCDSLTDVYYNGTQEDWKRVYADENNELLLNAAIHFKAEPDPNAPVWKLSAAVFAGMLSTSVTNMSAETVTGTIIKVYYDEYDKIIDVKVNPLTLEPDDKLMSNESISIGKYVRIFAWDTALGMTPLSSDVTVNLS